MLSIKTLSKNSFLNLVIYINYQINWRPSDHGAFNVLDVVLTGKEVPMMEPWFALPDTSPHPAYIRGATPGLDRDLTLSSGTSPPTSRIISQLAGPLPTSVFFRFIIRKGLIVLTILN